MQPFNPLGQLLVPWLWPCCPAHTVLSYGSVTVFLLWANWWTRRGGNYSDVLPLKAARRDSIWGFKSELQTNPMPFYLELLWGATLTLMPHRGCAIDWDRTKLWGCVKTPVRF